MSRRTGVWVAVAVAVALAGEAASAQDSLDDLPAATTGGDRKVAEINGYLMGRFIGAYVNPGATAAPTRDVPSLQLQVEANAQVRVHLGSRAFIYGDLSLVWSPGWLYYGLDPAGERARVDEHDVASQRPSVITSELYLSVTPAPWLNLIVGKKRVVWGSGFAFNPTDLLNPPRDPTDPNLQRAGAWIAKIELPFERVTFSAVFSPQVLYQQSGLPYAFMRFPDYPPAETLAGRSPDPRDEHHHYLVAGRVYALVADADINLMYYFSNRYLDGFENKSRLGASFSRYFFTDYELHVEALFQKGSGRAVPDHYCATGTGACPDFTKALATTRLERDAIYSRVLVGFRTMFRDESVLSAEYYYQGDGDSDLEFEDRIRLLLKVRQLAGFGAINTSALPQRFNFDPLRRHYLIASWQKPKIRDDWTLSVVTLLSLRDLSGVVNPQVMWNAREWLNLTLNVFVPIRGIPVNQAVVDDRSYSEFSLIPYDVRVLFEARAFY